ncbi:MAG: beta-ketoacyl-[acyl-carrier-protein] synthase family protein [Coriobacteriales bacterium]|jgi:3-oxoacyl-[acyl-carrier-protein] synthase II|nr:beta-ketoacyl-[acyl-carrier-protein] synthase family protein [Coriobacteriales bacterium]
MQLERIVITGMGAVACNGQNSEEFIANVNQCVSGIKTCTRYDMSELRSQLVGEIDYDALYSSLPNEDEIEKTIYLAYYAAYYAIKDSGVDFTKYTDKNIAIVIGSLFGGYNTSAYVHDKFIVDHKLSDINTKILDFFSACSIPNYLSKKFGIKGAKFVISNACASGGSAVGFAYDLIKSGLADVAISGGTDELNRLSLAGFNSLGALASENCAPYTNSSGINIGEGAGIFIVEKLSDVKAREGRSYAEIIGYELNSDAFHVTAPDPNGEGAFRAMKSLLERNHISTDDVSYVNGHGTGTNANDTSEMKSVKRLFANSTSVGKLTSNKGVIGHCMGAAGALELFISAKSIQDHIIPPTFHTEKQKELAEIHIVKESENDPCDFVVSNSFAFGGNNVSIGISSTEHFSKEQLDSVLIDDDIVITGVGCIGNNHASFDDYLEMLKTNEVKFQTNESYVGKYTSISCGTIPDYDYRKYMSPDFFRKTDIVSKLSMVSSAAALKDAEIKVTRTNAERIGLVYGTGTGPMSTIEQLNLDIINKGLAGMNAFFFPNSVNNAAPGYITMNNRIKGTTITINSGGATFVASLLYAKIILQQNKADQVIVTVADDNNEIYHSAYDRLGLLSDCDCVKQFFTRKNTMLLSAGSVSVLLERKSTALERNAKMYAKVLGGSLSGDCNSVNGLNLQSAAMTDAFNLTLKSCNMAIDDIDLYFSSSTGIAALDFIEKKKVIKNCGDAIISSARQFCGYNISIVPAYSTLSAIAAFAGYPIYSIRNGLIERVENSVENCTSNINNAMIASYAFGETYGNVVLSKI